MSFRTSRQSAFTLVEILIVLVIIAQLAAILLPTLSRVRETARRASCASNLRQMGFAITLYSQDNDDYLPHKSTERLSFTQSCAWADRVLPYTKDSTVFVCPSTKNLPYVPGCVADSTIEHDDYDGFVSYDGAYNMNRLTFAAASFPFEASCTHPSTTISVLDGNGGTLQQFNNDMTTREGLADAGMVNPRHLSGYNVLFLDGHVKWMNIDQLLVASLWKAGD